MPALPELHDIADPHAHPQQRPLVSDAADPAGALVRSGIEHHPAVDSTAASVRLLLRHQGGSGVGVVAGTWRLLLVKAVKRRTRLLRGVGGLFLAGSATRRYGSGLLARDRGSRTAVSALHIVFRKVRTT
jgi:hypothetical protein